MNKKVALIIGISIILSSLVMGLLIRDAILSNQKILDEKINQETNNEILSLSEAAQYLKLSEKEVKGIMIIERKQLKSYGSFLGKMFPYYKVNDKYYFYKDELDEWLKEVSSNRTQYDTYKFTRK